MKTLLQAGSQAAVLAVIVVGVLSEITPILNLVKYGTPMLTLLIIMTAAGKALSEEYKQTKRRLAWYTVLFYFLAVGILAATGHFVLATFWVATGLIAKVGRGYEKKETIK